MVSRAQGLRQRTSRLQTPEMLLFWSVDRYPGKGISDFTLLQESCETGNPVRVVRGAELRSEYAPPGG